MGLHEKNDHMVIERSHYGLQIRLLGLKKTSLDHPDP